MASIQGHETNKIVAQNIRDERMRRHWNFADLKRALEAVKHPLAIAVLQRIELSQRRINVDDLTAFATVFSVSPSDLLAPLDKINPLDNIWRQDAGLLTGLPALTRAEVHGWLTKELKNLGLEARIEHAAKIVADMAFRRAELEKEIIAEADRKRRHELEGILISLEAEHNMFDKHLEELKNVELDNP